MDEILFKWTNSDGISINARGKYFNAKELNTLEKFYGSVYNNNGAGERVSASKAKEMHDLYDNVKKYYMGWMMAQTHLKEEFANIEFRFVGDNAENIIFDFSKVQASIQELLSKDFVAGKKLLGDFTNVVVSMEFNTGKSFNDFCQYFIKQGEELAFEVYAAGRNVVEGTADNDNLTSATGSTIVRGGAGDDTIRSEEQDDILFGGIGNDKLYGNSGNDILDGGAGNDNLEGGAGDDTYIWGSGSGNDTIVNTAGDYYDAAEKKWKWNNNGQDTVKFGEGLTRDSMSFVQSGEDIIFTNKVTGETLKVKNWFVDDTYRIEKFQFANGSAMTSQDINTAIEEFNSQSKSKVLVSSPALAGVPTAALHDSVDTTMQRIACASILFDADRQDLGCAEPLLGTSSIEQTSRLTFGSDSDLNADQQMSRYIQTSRQSSAV